MSMLYTAPRFASLAALALATLFSVSAHASSPDNGLLPDAAGMAILEQRAASAAPREQCILYAELLHNLTELAGQQMTKGEDEAATSTFQHIDAVANKLEKVSARDAKRLKNAELLLERISHRVSDMAKAASGEERTLVQATLHHVESVHSGLLALVFSH